MTARLYEKAGEPMAVPRQTRAPLRQRAADVAVWAVLAGSALFIAALLIWEQTT
jgi:hypothetical protein